MRVLHAATHEHTGAGRAAARIHAALRASGVDSELLVLYGDAADPGTEVLGDPVRRRVATLHRRLEEGLLGLQRSGDDAYRSLGLGGAPGLARIRAKRPDIVHLHWIPGLLGIADLPQLPAPAVWTLHDAWPICGAEHYAGAARPREGYTAANRPPGSGGLDLDRWTWERKRAHWRGFDPLLVCTSRWMADEVRASALFRGRPVRVIPNPLDTALYRPLDRAAARSRLGLPPGRPLLLFSAWRATEDRRKGFAVLAEALRLLGARGLAGTFDLVVAGAAGTQPVHGFATHWREGSADEARMRDLYSACEMIAIPSLSDNSPNTLAEAMACGAAVAGSDAGGIPDLLRHGETGLVAARGDAAQLAERLAALAGDAGLRARLAEAGRRAVESACAPAVVAAQYADAYRDALAGKTAR